MNGSILHRLSLLERATPGTLRGLFLVEGQLEPVEMPVRDAAHLLPGVELVRIIGGNRLSDLDEYLDAFRTAVKGGAYDTFD